MSSCQLVYVNLITMSLYNSGHTVAMFLVLEQVKKVF